MRHKNRKIGIAISLYDKFEELQLLVDIIRKNWKGNYIITVCSNHPEGEKNIKELKLPVDRFIRGDNIPYNSSKPVENLTYRVMDTIKKSCQAAMAMGADVVMHIHADAWPLNENKFLELVERMITMNKKFAARGFGYGYYRSDAPLGHLDDMFFIFNSHFIQKIGFFDFHTLNLLPHKLTVHGILSTLVFCRVGLENLYLYDDHTNIDTWGDQKKIMPYERAKPLIFDKKNYFLHVHREEFPNGYGRVMQAIFLKKYNLVNGRYIKRFIENYCKGEKEVYAYLREIDKLLDRRLMLLGYDVQEFGQCFTKKELAIKEITIKKFLSNYFFRITIFFLNFLLRIIGKKPFSRHHQRDTIWPEDISSLYRKKINLKDFQGSLHGARIFFEQKE